MICNAGIGFPRDARAVDAGRVEEARRRQRPRHLYAAHAAHEVFTRQGHGHLIAISSVAGLRGVVRHERVLRDQSGTDGFHRRPAHGSSSGRASMLPLFIPSRRVTEFHEAMHRTFGHAVRGQGSRAGRRVGCRGGDAVP
jgi:hypothetical protein